MTAAPAILPANRCFSKQEGEVTTMLGNPHAIQLLQGLDYGTSGFRSKSWSLQPQRASLPGCPAGLTLAGTSASAHRRSDTPSRAQAADTA
jgi:hypothetical protein